MQNALQSNSDRVHTSDALQWDAQSYACQQSLSPCHAMPRGCLQCKLRLHHERACALSGVNEREDAGHPPAGCLYTFLVLRLLLAARRNYWGVHNIHVHAGMFSDAAMMSMSRRVLSECFHTSCCFRLLSWPIFRMAAANRSSCFSLRERALLSRGSSTTTTPDRFACWLLASLHAETQGGRQILFSRGQNIKPAGLTLG